MTEGTEDSSQARLAAIAGVRPSRGWLQACRSHLIAQGETGGDDDALLHQILHSDLRDVVRRSDEDTESSGEDAPLALRRAIRQSLPSANDPPCKSTLPEGFVLLVQVEECIDLSLNAESRASVGPAPPSAPTPVGDQRKRCLKMFISDGCYHSGSPYPSRAHTSVDAPEVCEAQHVVAMETSPIPDISVHSQPGVKLLLRGPIDIRLGMLLLNEGNTTILGGLVEGLIPVQKKAREAARRLAGVGVDPTIKALIWNPITGSEEEEDEGEEASGDVQAPVETMALRPSNSNATTPGNQGQNATLIDAEGTQRVVRAVADQGHDSSSPHLAQNGGRYIPRNNNISSNEHSVQEQNQRQQNLHSNQPRNSANQPAAEDIEMMEVNSEPLAITSLSSSFRSPSQKRAGNPYANRNPYASSSTNTPQGFPHMRTQSDDSVLQATSIEEGLLTSDGLTHSTSTVARMSPDHSSTSRTTLETPRGPAPLDSAPSSGSVLGSACPKSSQGSSVAATQSNSKGAGGAIGKRGLALSPTALSEPMSFAELRKLLIKAIASPTTYGSYEGRNFIVPAKMKDIMHFNIARVKGKRKKCKDGKKTDKQYEFVMRCLFTGPEASDENVTCRIASSLLQPFFDVDPYELRKMHRENKEHGNKIVSEKGQEILSELQPLASLHLKLLLTRDEFFKQENVPIRVDGDCAILLVCARDDLL